MSFPISSTPSATSSALQGIRTYSLRAAKAAEKIARAGLNDAPAAPSDEPAPVNAEPQGDADLPAAMIDLMIAQRAFSAQLRVLEAAAEMAQETVNLSRRKA